MTQTDSAYSAYVHCEPNGVSLVGSGGIARLAAGCVLELGRGRGISNLDKKARITRPAPLI